MPDQNRPALVQPGQRPLEHPAARLASARPSFSAFLANRANVVDVVKLLDRLVSRGGVVALVHAQMLLAVGSSGRDGVQQILQTSRIVPVGRGRHHRQRPDLAIDQEVLFRAVFGPIRGVGAHIAPPKRALPKALSAACHFRSTPECSSQCLTSTAQICSITPSCHQRRKRAMHRGVVAELFGQTIPLAAGPHPVNDAVDRLAPNLPAAARFSCVARSASAPARSTPTERRRSPRWWLAAPFSCASLTSIFREARGLRNCPSCAKTSSEIVS